MGGGGGLGVFWFLILKYHAVYNTIFCTPSVQLCGILFKRNYSSRKEKEKDQLKRIIL